MEIFLEDFIEYELAMMKHCDIENLLGVKSIREVDGVRLIYDDEYYPILFKGEKISTFVCNKLFKALRSLYYNLGDYLLSPSKLSLNMDNVMINDEGDVGFVYIPEKSGGSSFFESLELMLKEVLAHMEDDEKILSAMHKLGVNGKLGEKNIDYFFELFK